MHGAGPPDRLRQRGGRRQEGVPRRRQRPRRSPRGWSASRPRRSRPLLGPAVLGEGPEGQGRVPDRSTRSTRLLEPHGQTVRGTGVGRLGGRLIDPAGRRPDRRRSGSSRGFQEQAMTDGTEFSLPDGDARADPGGRPAGPAARDRDRVPQPRARRPPDAPRADPRRRAGDHFLPAQDARSGRSSRAPPAGRVAAAVADPARADGPAAPPMPDRSRPTRRRADRGRRPRTPSRRPDRPRPPSVRRRPARRPAESRRRSTSTADGLQPVEPPGGRADRRRRPDAGRRRATPAAPTPDGRSPADADRPTVDDPAPPARGRRPSPPRTRSSATSSARPSRRTPSVRTSKG